ncbi:MAG: Hsp20/alpha crystallin family protein [Saprospiraceae bacterium]|nr:Hsp20/alpha crystallin family protein [Saprospiraceae bacterium]
MTSVVKFQPFPATKVFANGLLDEFFNRGLNEFIGQDAITSHPAANVTETAEAFKIELAAPGFDKQHFSLNIDKDQLIIAAERGTKNEKETAEKFLRREFRYETFKRAFKLPQIVNQEGIAAVYENGILSVTLPKKEEAKPVVRTIEIG